MTKADEPRQQDPADGEQKPAQPVAPAGSEAVRGKDRPRHVSSTSRSGTRAIVTIGRHGR
jgi:hypothetical protein